MRILAVCCLGTILVAGCPTQQTGDTSPVTAAIGASATSGPAPLTVAFSAANSSSQTGGNLTYAWDFDDGTSSDQVQVIHTFERPGRYIVRLQVTDGAGNQGLTSVEVRAAGTGVVAIMAADPSSGTAPLTVQFDGTSSIATDDTVLDYYWDFGDGSQSRDAQPQHTFVADGAYIVTLRIISAGGLEATTHATINVSKANASLQFDGLTVATLPLGAAPTLAVFTLEMWVKADIQGGTAATLGNGALTLEVLPTTNTLRLQVNGTPLEASAANLAGAWRHLAVVYDSVTAGVCVLYLDGLPLTNMPATATVTADQITLGLGFRGKIGEVQVWAEARQSTAILAQRNIPLTGDEANLLDYCRSPKAAGRSSTTWLSLMRTASSARRAPSRPSTPPGAPRARCRSTPELRSGPCPPDVWPSAGWRGTVWRPSRSCRCRAPTRANSPALWCWPARACSIPTRAA
jgi:PKD repeat protein